MSTGFHTLAVADVRRETDDAVSIRFAVPDHLADAFRFRPGQHVTLRREFAAGEVRRNYSVCVAPEDGELRIAVKRIDGGLFSTWATQRLKLGEPIEVMPPHGSFTWTFDPTRARRYVGIAGGSGITPVLSLLKTALTVEPNSRFTLLYGNRDGDSIIFLETLAQLKDRFLDRLELYHFLEHEEQEIDLFNGRLDRAKCDEVFGTLVRPTDIDAFFICGPGPMMESAEQSLVASGVDPARILVERFTAGALTPAQSAAATALVEKAAGLRFVAILDGRKRVVSFDSAAGNMLDSARAAGLPAPYACKAGVCATCRARIVAGKVDMATNYGLSADEVAQGYVLTCQTVPMTPDVVVDYDA